MGARFACRLILALLATQSAYACGGNVDVGVQRRPGDPFAVAPVDAGGSAVTGAGGFGAEEPPTNVPMRFLPDEPPMRNQSSGENEVGTFEEPECPELMRIQGDQECDLFADVTGCPPGLGCYPYAEYPNGRCSAEEFGTRCDIPGAGLQGDDCFDGCADGLICVSTGQGSQCISVCPIGAPNTCPSGLLCVPVDVEGVGGCF